MVSHLRTYGLGVTVTPASPLCLVVLLNGQYVQAVILLDVSTSSHLIVLYPVA